MHAPWAPVIASMTGGHPAFAPGPLRWSDLATEWRPDPLTLALIALAAAGYVWYRVRGQRAGVAWTRRRDITFAAGIVAAVWVSSGAVQVRAAQVEWIWIAQLLSLLLVVPLVVLAGQPVRLARDVAGGSSAVTRLVDSRPVRAISHPLIGPALVPIVFLVLLFGGVGEAAAASPAVGWLLHVALLLLGAAIALPLADGVGMRTSLAVGVALVVGFIELIMDVFPGIVLRLITHPVIGYFAVHTPAWEGGWLHAQHDAGGLLWMAAEVLDLPFVVFVMVRWSRVDAAEAAVIDARLDADALGESETGRPWFLDDPQLRDRFQV